MRIVLITGGHFVKTYNLVEQIGPEIANAKQRIQHALQKVEKDVIGAYKRVIVPQ